MEARNLWDIYYGIPIYDAYFDEAIIVSFGILNKIKTRG